MKDLNSQIDAMFREKIYYVLAENGSKIKKINIRYTKFNQKFSPEHLESILGSFEKTIREIPRQLLRIEKSSRLKYQVPLDEERRCEILKMMTTDIEMLVEKMNRDYGTIFKDHKCLEEFDCRMQKTVTTAKQKMDEDTQKIIDILNEKLGSTPKLQPEELAKFYDLDESALLDLKAIEPLQFIHKYFDSMSDDPNAKVAFEGLRRGIVLCSKFGTQIQIDPRKKNTVEARRLIKMSIIAGTLVLKDLIDNVHILAQQLNLPIEKRNEDIIDKTITRLKEKIMEQEGAEKVLDSLDPFFQMLAFSEKCN